MSTQQEHFGRSVGWVRAKRNLFAEFPDSNHYDWDVSDLPDGTSSQILSQACHKGLIRKTGEKEVEFENAKGSRNQYQTTERLDQILEHVGHPDGDLPCGHTGIRNLRDGGYTCNVDFCDEEFTREEAEEAIKS